MEYRIIKCTKCNNSVYYLVQEKKKKFWTGKIYWETITGIGYDDLGCYCYDIHFDTFEEAEENVYELKGLIKEEVVAHY